LSLENLNLSNRPARDEFGEVVEASIDGIGTMCIIVDAELPPADGIGARLPPVDSYR